MAIWCSPFAPSGPAVDIDGKRRGGLFAVGRARAPSGRQLRLRRVSWTAATSAQFHSCQVISCTLTGSHPIRSKTPGVWCEPTIVREATAHHALVSVKGPFLALPETRSISTSCSLARKIDNFGSPTIALIIQESLQFTTEERDRNPKLSQIHIHSRPECGLLSAVDRP